MKRPQPGRQGGRFLFAMMLSFVFGFVLGVACEYWLQTHRPPRHIREAEEVAETAWDSN